MENGILWAKVNTPISHPRRFSNTPQEQHITLEYGAKHSRFLPIMSLKFQARIIAIAHNDRVECFKVDPDHLEKSLKAIDFEGVIPEHPHITLSWDEGNHPVAALDMLREGSYSEEPITPTMVNCSMGFKQFIPYLLCNPNARLLLPMGVGNSKTINRIDHDIAVYYLKYRRTDGTVRGYVPIEYQELLGKLTGLDIPSSAAEPIELPPVFNAIVAFVDDSGEVSWAMVE